MALDSVKNFCEVIVSTGYDASATSIVLASNEGAKLPVVPFNVVWYNFTDYPKIYDDPNVEIVRVTVIATDTLTVTRGQEGISATTKNTADKVYKMALLLTAKMITDINTSLVSKLVSPLTADLNANNYNIVEAKLLMFDSLIDDGNSGTDKIINWNLGAVHKLTLTGNVTITFSGDPSDNVPTMTSDTTPSGECIGDVPAYGARWKAFDDSLASDSYWAYASFSPPKYLGYHFTSGKVIIWYSLVRDSGGEAPPKTWTFRGSNDGTNWDTLDTQTDITTGWGTYGSPIKKTFVITNTTSYAYYSINVTASNGADMSIGEFEMSEGTAFPSLPCFLALKLIQDGTGGRTVTWPSTVKGTIAVNRTIASETYVLFFFDGTNFNLIGVTPWTSVPATAGAVGAPGQIAYDGTYLYICSASNTWLRVAIATWS